MNDLKNDLTGLIDENDIQYFSSLLREMFTETQQAEDETHVSGFDICRLATSKKDSANVILIKELALNMGLIRPANGKNEQMYFLTLKGFAIGQNDNGRIDKLKNLIKQFLKEWDSK